MPGAHFTNSRRKQSHAQAFENVDANPLLSPSESFTSNGTPRPPRPRKQLPRNDFPLLDWLAIGNHLFTVGSLFYFLMNFSRFALGSDINSNISIGIANAMFVNLGLIFVMSSAAYWVDILLFPAHWKRRQFYHPLKREEEHVDDEEEYILATSNSSMSFTSDSSLRMTTTLKPMHITVASNGRGDQGMYDEENTREWSTNNNGAMRVGQLGNINNQVSSTTNPFNRRRKSSADENSDDDDDIYGRSSGPSCGSRWCPRLCPVRTESWCELLNLSGALINTISSLLPYVLKTFQADHGVSFDSVPITIALMDFFAMCVWLASSLLVFYVWRRDRLAQAEEDWEEAEERRTGVPIALRQRAEELERIAEEVAEARGQPIPVSASPRFQRKKVPLLLTAVGSVSFWAVLCNIVGSLVYWSACIYGITLSVAAARGKSHNQENARNTFNGAPSTPDEVTPQIVQGWVATQRLLNLIGDSVYLGCAVCCELVYYIETHREMNSSDSRAMSAVAPATASLPESRKRSLSSSMSSPLQFPRSESISAQASPSIPFGETPSHLLLPSTGHPAAPDGANGAAGFHRRNLTQHLNRGAARRMSAGRGERKLEDEFQFDHTHDDVDLDSGTATGGLRMNMPSYRFTTTTITADSMQPPPGHLSAEAVRRPLVGSPFDSEFEASVR